MSNLEQEDNNLNLTLRTNSDMRTRNEKKTHESRTMVFTHRKNIPEMNDKIKTSLSCPIHWFRA